ncbi:MAG: 16S rRNA (guanine(527)-N(7))-methyltransferase RsmG [Anaerovoracaceae bacterium]
MNRLMEALTKLENLLDEDITLNEPRKLDIFASYMVKLLEWNEKVNLTNIVEQREFIDKHYIDSILCANSPEFLEAKTVIDIGTGGGFPGIPLAILFPQKKFVLVDSLNKRLKIIREICDELGIKNVIVVHGRAEELARKKDMREQFDLCVSRAVANLSSLSELCLPFVKVGGAFIAYKGPNIEEELVNGRTAIQKLGGEIDRIEHPEMQEGQNHNLLYVIKMTSTNKKYPRKPGEPVRNPLK